MTAENRAEFILSFEGDGAGIAKIFTAFKNQVVSEVREIEQTTKNFKLFENLDSDLKKAAASVDSTRASLEALQRSADALRDAAGGPIGRDIAKGLGDAEKAAVKAEAAFIKQSTAVDRLRTTLKTANVDLSNLAAAEAKLATQADAAAKAATNQAAQQALGLRTLKDIAPEIARLNAAYNTLSTSGTLSVKELAVAHQQLNTRTAELKASVTGIATAAKAGAPDFLAFFQSTLLPAIGITASVGTLVAGLKDAIEQAKAFNQGIAEIGTVTNLSKAGLASLGDGARALARTLGVDLQESLKAVFELIRSGVPPENALDVLRVSAQAAKASLADVGTGAKASQVLLDAFGASIGDLPLLFDKIVRGAHDGGASLSEFANSAAPLLNVARAAGISFDDLLATLTVLVSKSGNAEKSIGDLTKIIAKLDTTEVRAKLRDLGITGDTLVEIFQQIGARGLSLNEVLGVGLSGAGVKSAASIATLTNNSKELPKELDKIKASAGETKKSLDALLDSPKERSARFNAEINQAAVSIGNFFGSGSRLAQLGTLIVHEFNQIPAAFDAVGAASNDANAKFLDVVAAFLQMDPLAANAARSLAATGGAAEVAGQQFVGSTEAINRANTALSDFNTALLADIKALQEATTRDIADVGARADAQVAALDRSKAAEAATAIATLEILLKAAADKLRLIEDSEKKITEATSLAIAAREKAARAAGENEKKIAGDSAAARIASIGGTLAAYQNLYAQLVALAQGALAKVQTFEEARVAIAQSVENAIRKIRFDALTGLDQYVARLAEVDRLVSEGRRKAAEGDTAAAKQFFEQAIAESNGLAKIVNEDGVVIITATQAQTSKVEALNKIQRAANEAFGEQAVAAKKGADGAIEQANLVAEKVAELQAQYDQLKAAVAEGLKFRVDLDQQSVTEAFAKLDELTKPRTVKVTVETVNADGTPASSSGGGNGEHFASGGYVRGYARGGSVFRRPSWTKVPGSGNGDTVPAALQPGSFVVRKSASSYYGDGIMARLARGMGLRGYAGGGLVTKDAVAQWAEKTWGFNPFATGAPATDPKSGFRSGDSFQGDVHPPITFDMPQVPEELITAMNVIAYAKEMLNWVGPNNPLLGVLKEWILDSITALDRNPGDQKALALLLQSASTIGLNPYLFDMWGKTAGSTGQFTPVSFYDWLRDRGALQGGAGQGIGVSSGGFAQRFFGVGDFAQRFFMQAIEQAGSPPGALRPPGQKVFRRFSQGGDTDTVAALLTPGETVINKAATQKVERSAPGLLHAINSMSIPRRLLAGIARFAGGGQVGGIGGRVLLGAKGKVSLGAFGDEFAELVDPLFDLKEKARDLPKSTTGLDLSEWATRVLENFEDFDANRKRKIKEVVDDGLTSWLKNIESARRFRTPAVMDANVAALAFAEGGSVPSMLTPGERVFAPGVAGRYWPGFLQGINSMAIPRDFVANMLQPPPMPARFAEGGPVGIGFAPGATNPTADRSITVNINANAGDLFSEQNVRRFIYPVLRDIDRRST